MKYRDPKTTKPARILTFVISVVISFSLALGLSSPAAAQIQTPSSLSLSIWPPLLEVMIKPGKSITQVYKIDNHSERDLLLIPQLYPFRPDGQEGLLKLSQPESDPLFLSFDSGEKFNEPFRVKVGETRSMVLKIAIPEKQPERDHYYTLLFSTVSLEDPQQTQSSSITKIGSNILITISQTGKPRLDAKIASFSVPKLLDPSQAASFDLRLHNPGNSYWKPFGDIEVAGPFNQKKTLHLLEQNVLSDSTRKISAEGYKPALPIGRFRATVKFALDPSDKNFYSQTIYFWYVPVRLICLILGILFTGVVFLLLRTKVRKASLDK